MKEVHKFPH